MFEEVTTLTSYAEMGFLSLVGESEPQVLLPLNKLEKVMNSFNALLAAAKE